MHQVSSLHQTQIESAQVFPIWYYRKFHSQCPETSRNLSSFPPKSNLQIGAKAFHRHSAQATNLPEAF